MNFPRLQVDCKNHHSGVWTISAFPNNNLFQEKACSSAASGVYASKAQELGPAGALLWRIFCVLNKTYPSQNFNFSLESYRFVDGNHFLLIIHGLGAENVGLLSSNWKKIPNFHFSSFSHSVSISLCSPILKNNRKGFFWVWFFFF